MKLMLPQHTPLYIKSLCMLMWVCVVVLLLYIICSDICQESHYFEHTARGLFVCWESVLAQLIEYTYRIHFVREYLSVCII